jgi:hypothetical protein
MPQGVFKNRSGGEEEGGGGGVLFCCKVFGCDGDGEGIERRRRKKNRWRG